MKRFYDLLSLVLFLFIVGYWMDRKIAVAGVVRADDGRVRQLTFNSKPVYEIYCDPPLHGILDSQGRLEVMYWEPEKKK
jgi:hypothetical protein